MLKVGFSQKGFKLAIKIIIFHSDTNFPLKFSLLDRKYVQEWNMKFFKDKSQRFFDNKLPLQSL